MEKLYGKYPGYVQVVYPPEHPENACKTQYEYSIQVRYENFSTLPVKHAIVADMFGANDDFSDKIMLPGQAVLVEFLMGDPRYPVVTGWLRKAAKQQSSKGRVFEERFNQITTLIDKAGNQSVKSDGGPNSQVNVKSVVLDDSVGEKITLDKEKKTLTVEANDLTIIVKGKATITVEKDLTLTANAKVTATIKDSLTAKCKDLNVDASGAAKIKVAKDAEIKAKTVKLNGSAGSVLTTATQATCYVTGIPFKGTSKVKAG